MLLRPRAEWIAIDEEPATVWGLYAGYACVLAAIPQFAGLAGGLIFMRYTSPVLYAATAVLGYAISLVGVALAAVILNALAAPFEARKSYVQALKLVTYSGTAVWLAGALNVIALGAVLALAGGGLYSLYTFYLGLPKLMNSPANKTIPYFVTSIALVLPIFFAFSFVINVISVWL